MNLVSNAVRYSPDGGRIDVRFARSPGGARFEVEDRGLGIPPEHLARITERFYRVDLASARVRGGTGLGLAITKHVLKRHGCVLEVQSRLGKGSTFACEFPARIVSNHFADQETA
jgi:two-component system phosphate regulon sensor histidine kinase PhoR